MAKIPWPAANARLLEVNAPGAPDGYGDVAAKGAQLWFGSIEAALSRKRLAEEDRRRGAESEATLVTVEADVLVVREPPAEITELTPGDQGTAHTVLVEDRRVAPFVQRRWHVVSTENRARGLQSDSLRLVLADPRAEA